MMKRRVLAVIGVAAVCAGAFAPGASAGPPGPGPCRIPGSVIAFVATYGANPNFAFQKKFGSSPGQVIAYLCTPAGGP